jgi:hypothetical protein
MELSAAQRRIAFALVVFALAGLGVYLFTSSSGASQQRAGGQVGSGQPGPGSSVSSPAGGLGQQSAPVTSPAASPSPDGPPSATSVPGAPDIYQWLPFTKAGLSSAAAVAVRFGAAYGTFSYTESAAAYLATMSDLVTSQLGQQISAAYSAPGVASVRTGTKQVSTGTASISSLRAFGPTSLTFIVPVTEQITATRGAGPNTTVYAITVTGGGTSWQVSDIELRSAGNS